MEATLLWSSKTKDKDGFPVETEHSVDIFAEEKSIVRAEFYEAMRAGVEVKLVLETRQEDFELSAHEEDGKFQSTLSSQRVTAKFHKNHIQFL